MTGWASPQHSLADTLSLRFLQASGVADGQMSRNRTPGLLHDMRQFMGDQFAPSHGRRLVVPAGKCDVSAGAVGVGAHRVGTGGSQRIGVQLHLAQIMLEARLEERARLRIQRMPGRAEHLVHDGRR